MVYQKHFRSFIQDLKKIQERRKVHQQLPESQSLELNNNTNSEKINGKDSSDKCMVINSIIGNKKSLSATSLKPTESIDGDIITQGDELRRLKTNRSLRHTRSGRTIKQVQLHSSLHTYVKATGIDTNSRPPCLSDGVLSNHPCSSVHLSIRL